MNQESSVLVKNISLADLTAFVIGNIIDILDASTKGLYIRRDRYELL